MCGVIHAKAGKQNILLVSVVEGKPFSTNGNSWVTS
ncbi:hypothetical protein Pan14r_10490 [Crateriforma conspicua]|uniref:Uncharacterized protein n=1 Tax=Crateriforma conspicua TaxID=2527996 RepID=A0A5C5Y5S3_9PLAN|nr:hypothetical protein Mal65_15590 [Crateriforma conspicua]TWT68802.1 hypothetical protein Pan14r_10490 [Crateriforma conspicua]